jgi:glycosyltransferase involved in cell wall biosynthesis
VAQIALYEKSRESMLGSTNLAEYDYPYKLLFNRSLDSVGIIERTTALFREFFAYKPDILNITGYFDVAQVVLMVYARLVGVKVIISSESSLADKARSPLKESLKKLILGRANAFFCFGSSTATYLQTLGIPINKILVKKAAVVDNARIRSQYLSAKTSTTTAKTHNFIYVGRLAEEKNLQTLLSAYKDSLANEMADNNWGLIIVGEGPERATLEAFANNHSLENVTFIGGVSWQEVPTSLARASVLILPSYSEPWGLVVNEAMVCGMPVIVSENCGCVSDLVEPSGNGFIFDPTDKNALIEAMNYCVNHPDQLTKFGNRSKEIIKLFSPQSVAIDMVKAYQQLA